MRFRSWYTEIKLLVISFYRTRIFCSLKIDWNRIWKDSLHFLFPLRFSSNFHIYSILDMRFRSWYTEIELLMMSFYRARVFCSLKVDWNRIWKNSLHFFLSLRFSLNFHIFFASLQILKYSIFILLQSLIVESKNWCSFECWVKATFERIEFKLSIESRWIDRTFRRQLTHSSISNIWQSINWWYAKHVNIQCDRVKFSNIIKNLITNEANNEQKICKLRFNHDSTCFNIRSSWNCSIE